MKAESKYYQRALSLVEVLVIISVLVILLGLILPALANAKKKTKRVACTNNLKQLTLGLGLWAEEHSGDYPPRVSTNRGGTLEWANTKEVYRHFLSAKIDIGSPKLLFCPSDIDRNLAKSFSELNNEKISYFLNLSAVRTDERPHILSGDRHLTYNGVQYPNGSYLISTQQMLAWGLKLHPKVGNISLTDGSVQATINNNLQRIILGLGPQTNWLAFP